MLRSLTILVALVLVTGCATTNPEAQRARLEPVPAFDDEAVVARALAFDPPGAVDLPPIALAREPRQPVAVLGYEDLVTTLYYLRMDDRQFITTRDEWTVRRAITTRLGVSYR